MLFKSGYQSRTLTNELTGENKGARRRSDWNGKVIAMKSFTVNGKNTYLDWDFEISLGFLTATDTWKKTPCALLALDAEAKRVGLKSIVNFFPVSDTEQNGIKNFFAKTKQCKKP